MAKLCPTPGITRQMGPATCYSSTRETASFVRKLKNGEWPTHAGVMLPSLWTSMVTVGWISTWSTISAGWAWGGGFIDFDNDGWEDLYTPNGFISGKSMKDT